MAWGAVAGQAVGSIIGGAFSLGGQAMAQNFAAEEARKQRRWATRQYRKRYQNTVRDLRLAGLNPILAAGGAPGSVPSGASASSPGFARGDSVGAGLSSAYMRYLEAKNLIATNKVLAVTAKKVGAEWFRTEEEGIRAREETSNLRARNELLRAELPAADTKRRLDETNVGRRTREMELIMRRLFPFFQSAAKVTR